MDTEPLLSKPQTLTFCRHRCLLVMEDAHKRSASAEVFHNLNLVSFRVLPLLSYQFFGCVFTCFRISSEHSIEAQSSFRVPKSGVRSIANGRRDAVER